jgi:hypothetical protein
MSRRRTRRFLITIAALLTALVASALVSSSLVAARPQASRSHACGGHERWAIKTLFDEPQASQVDFAHPVRTTIDRMRALRSRPEKVSSRVGRIRPVEFRVYRLRATLHEAKLEPDDDIHLVIHDENPEDTMIIEFPDTRCTAAMLSTKSQQMAEAREDFLTHITGCRGGQRPSLRSFTEIGGRATITGVGFWDVKHGTAQRGRAPQDIELHPVLAFQRGSCS